MRDKGRNPRGLFGSLSMIAAGCVLSLAAVAETSLEDDLKRCGALQDQAARLACYDEIVDRKPEPEAATPAAVEPEAEAESPTPAVVGADTEVQQAETETETAVAEEVAASESASDERLATLGDEQLGGKKSETEELEVQARVVGCRKDDFRRYYFYFENGQVWKQKSDRRLSYKDCNFNITVTKDFFGYKMLPEGETRRIRISRIK